MRGRNVILGFLAILVMESCDTPPPVEPTPTPTQGTVTELPDPPIIEVWDSNPVPQSGLSSSVAPIYIAIDDSISMNQKDQAGEACDAQMWRYKIPFLALRIFKDWEANNVNNAFSQSSLYWMRQRDVDRESDDFLKALEKKINNPFVPPQRDTGKPQFEQMLEKYRKNLRAIKESGVASPQSAFFMFSDGDFRSVRPIDNNGNVVADRVLQLTREIHEEFPDSQINIVLLCTRRLEKQDHNDYLKTTWGDIRDKGFANVYGLDKAEVDVDKDEFLLSSLSFFMDAAGWPSEPEKIFDERSAYQRIAGWGLIQSGELTPVTLPPNITHLKFNSLPVDQQDKKPTVGLDDGTLPDPHAVVHPLDECQAPHQIKFYKVSAPSFYWWQASLPLYRAVPADKHKGDVYYIYNDKPAEINWSIQMASSFYPAVDITSPEAWLDCASFHLNIDDRWFNLERDGDIWRAKLDNIFLDRDDPSPLEPIPVTFNGRWLSKPQIAFDINGGGFFIAPRYFPTFDRAEIVSGGQASHEITSNQFSNYTSQANIHLKIYLKFFAAKYYPGWTNDQWQPKISFAGSGCDPQLTHDWSPEDDADNPLRLKYIVDYTAGVDSPTLDIVLGNQPDVVLKKCDTLKVLWNNWPQDKITQGWNSPSNLSCPLSWANDTRFDQLEAIDCK